MEFLRGKNLVVLIVLIVLAIFGPLWVAHGLGFKNLSNSDWIAFSGFYVAIFGAILSAFLGGAWGHHVSTIKENEKNEKIESALKSEISFLKSESINLLISLDDEFEFPKRSSYISSIPNERGYISKLLLETLINGADRTPGQINMIGRLGVYFNKFQGFYDKRRDSLISEDSDFYILGLDDTAIIIFHVVQLVYAIERLESDGVDFNVDDFEIDKRKFYVVYGLANLSMTKEKFNKLSSHLKGRIDKHSI